MDSVEKRDIMIHNRKKFFLVCILLIAILLVSGCTVDKQASSGNNASQENTGAAKEKSLIGVWESMGGIVTLVFRENGEYFAFNTFPAPGGYTPTYKFTWNKQSFTLYYADSENTSDEIRYTYTYTLEDGGDTLVLTSRQKERYVNGVLDWSDSPEKENNIAYRNNQYESPSSSATGQLAGSWESMKGHAYINFGDDGSYIISSATIPAPNGYTETYRYTSNTKSFTLYFADGDDPSVEMRVTYFYDIEDQGNTLIIRSKMEENFVNGVRNQSWPLEEERLIFFRK